MTKRTTARDQMLAAHIRYELAQYAPDRLAATIDAEIGALYVWLDAVPVSELAPPDQVLAALRRSLVERALPAEVVKLLGENAVIILELIQEEQAPLGEIVPKEVYDRIIDNLAAMQEMRQQLTHQLVNSAIYSRLIANVLYHGIKSFWVSEQGVARTIPGASAFVRLGQNALNAAAPQLEKNVDKQLIAFINDNLHQLITDSETFLNRTLNAALIRKVGDELWETAAGEPLRRLAAAADKQAADSWAEVGADLWRHLRETTLFDDILQAVVRGFYLRYGKLPAAQALARLGLAEDIAAREARALAEPLVQRALDAGFLEERIRARLTPFYDAYFDAQTEGGS